MTEQKDPNGVDAHEGGAKLDAGKNRISLLFMQYFPNAIEAITNVSEFGAKKYSPGGWKGVPDGYQRYTEAMARHYLADCKGEIFDPETKLPHDFQLAWNALARIEFGLKEGKYGMKLSKPDAEAFVQAFNADVTTKITGNEVAWKEDKPVEISAGNEIHDGDELVADMIASTETIDSLFRNRS